MKYVELKDFATHINVYLRMDNEFISYSDKMYVLRSSQNDVNEEFCKANDIEIIDIKHKGGTIVLDKSAIGYAFVAHDASNRILNNFMIKFITYLSLKGVTAEYKDNDILIDGYKVCSAGTQVIDKKSLLTYTTVHFSLHNDADLIRQICLKPMLKVPKGLSEFGVTKEDVLYFLEEYMRNQLTNQV